MKRLALVKYNFEVETSFKPYVKTDLGFSFNISGDTEFNIEDKDAFNRKNTVKFNKIGLYTGVAAGVEYNNFVTELSYHITISKMKAHLDGTATALGELAVNKNYNNHTLILSVGYKFNF